MAHCTLDMYTYTFLRTVLYSCIRYLQVMAFGLCIMIVNGLSSLPRRHFATVTDYSKRHNFNLKVFEAFTRYTYIVVIHAHCTCILTLCIGFYDYASIIYTVYMHINHFLDKICHYGILTEPAPIREHIHTRAVNVSIHIVGTHLESKLLVSVFSPLRRTMQ